MSEIGFMGKKYCRIVIVQLGQYGVKVIGANGALVHAGEVQLIIASAQ